MSNEFFKFLLVGVSNTLLSYILYIIFLTFLPYLPAYTVAYCAGIVTSYFLNSKFVFKTSISLIGFLKFPIVYLIQYSLGLLILWLLVEKLDISPVLGMAGVIIVTIPVTFLTSRLILRS